MNDQLNVVSDIDRGFRELIGSLSIKEIQSNKKLPAKMNAVINLLNKLPKVQPKAIDEQLIA
jgi:hypothetical protein